MTTAFNLRPDALAAIKQQDAERLATLKSPEDMADYLRSLGDDFDRKHLWHPYTSATAPTPALKVARTYGRTIELVDGTRLIDGLSSWWCCAHGYGIESITAAACEQVARMSHVMFAGFTHKGAIELGERLLALLPCMAHVFYSDSGSVAVEVALKMALQYQRAAGHPERHSFLTVRGGYHGDTWHAMSVCDPSGMHTVFGGLLPQHYFVTNPATPFPESHLEPLTAPEGVAAGTKVRAGASEGVGALGLATAGIDEGCLEEMEARLKGGAVAAVILEPIVQGANSMNFYHPAYLSALRALCDRYGALLILDEVATGFWRTGKRFAFEHSDIEPDLVLVGKALTAGYMPLAATLCNQKVAATISGATPAAFMHGPTFMANPLACATACAALDYFESYPLGIAATVARIEAQLKRELLPLLPQPHVRSVRVIGAIGVIELDFNLNPATVMAYAVQLGVWLRPMGNLLYVMPPYTTTEDELRCLCTAMRTIALALTA